MYKDNMDGLSITNYFALVATPDTKVGFTTFNLIAKFQSSSKIYITMMGIQRRTYGAVPQQGPLSPYTKLEDPIITNSNFYLPAIQLLDDFQRSLDFRSHNSWSKPLLIFIRHFL